MELKVEKRNDRVEMTYLNDGDTFKFDGVGGDYDYIFMRVPICRELDLDSGRYEDRNCYNLSLNEFDWVDESTVVNKVKLVGSVVI